MQPKLIVTEVHYEIKTNSELGALTHSKIYSAIGIDKIKELEKKVDKIVNYFQSKEYDVDTKIAKGDIKVEFHTKYIETFSQYIIISLHYIY